MSQRVCIGCDNITAMKRSLSIALLFVLSSIRGLGAQDLVITNARIVVGNGTVINQGSIVVRGGRIASAAAGAPAHQRGGRRSTRGA